MRLKSQEGSLSMGGSESLNSDWDLVSLLLSLRSVLSVAFILGLHEVPQ